MKQIVIIGCRRRQGRDVEEISCWWEIFGRDEDWQVWMKEEWARKISVLFKVLIFGFLEEFIDNIMMDCLEVDGIQSCFGVS